MKKIILTLVLAIPAFSQTSIKDALVKHWKVTGDFTIAVAKLMPADQYGFRPVPIELSFGQLMVQIAGANLNACSQASGMTRPAIPAKLTEALKEEKIDIDKEAAVKFLSDYLRLLQSGRRFDDAREARRRGGRPRAR